MFIMMFSFGERQTQPQRQTIYFLIMLNIYWFLEKKGTYYAKEYELKSKYLHFPSINVAEGDYDHPEPLSHLSIKKHILKEKRCYP